MKVYEFEGFLNPARVRIALEEKNQTDQLELVQINVPGGEYQTPAFLDKTRPAPCRCSNSKTA